MADSVLDEVDPAFPAGSGTGIPGIRALYRGAKRSAWDPLTAVPWELFDANAYSEETRWAGRVYWSGRAWGEYGAVSESPALQLRYDLDGLEPELSLFWALRTQEEARHAEVSVRMADLLGGYLDDLPPLVQPEPADLKGAGEVKDPPSGAPAPAAPAPAGPAQAGPAPEGGPPVESNAPHLGTRARALAPEVPVEATIAGLVCVAETIVLDVFRELVKEVVDPVAKEIFRLIVRDETRHCQFGWLYLEHRADKMTDSIRAACVAVMTAMVGEIELGGYRSPWLDPTRNPALVEIERRVFEAGLGGTTQEWEGPVLVSSIRALRERVARFRIELPTFRHPALGVI